MRRSHTPTEPSHPRRTRAAWNTLLLLTQVALLVAFGLALLFGGQRPVMPPYGPYTANPVSSPITPPATTPTPQVGR